MRRPIRAALPIKKVAPTPTLVLWRWDSSTVLVGAIKQLTEWRWALKCHAVFC
jgi:hypothetical protein